jgi:beta-ribofuranosylaminobenzene 5'-phosphate synthase
MTALRLQTPSRLHFGLLGWGPDAPRQFGGVGLMVDDPGITLTARPAPAWSAEGPLAERVLRVARSVAGQAPVPTAAFAVASAPSEHVGLGVGTQLSLAVAQALLVLGQATDVPLERLAQLTGRGLRSGIGLHGFRHGGLLVDGGRGRSQTVPPLLARLDFPPEWSVLLVNPARGPGLHGAAETKAFATLPPIPDRVTDRLCRTVLLGLMPAVLERDLDAFGASLSELQEQVGRCFAPAQGGTVASADSAAVVRHLRALGLRGVGQSSWGPTLYGFCETDRPTRDAIAASLMASCGLGPQSVRWTRASTTGTVQALVECAEPPFGCHAVGRDGERGDSG